MREINLIVIHHSAGPRSQTMEQIRVFHVTSRKWSEIGYHYVIEEDGAVRHGRDIAVPGAHAKGLNAHSIGICVTGDNTKPEAAWNEDQKVSLRLLVSILRAIFPHSQVRGHRDVGTTLCPGVDVHDVLELS